MRDTYSEVVQLISENHDISLETISPTSHLFDDLGLDSVDLFDLIFAIEDKFDISIPTKKWTMSREDLDPNDAAILVIKTFCERIDGLVAEKGA